MDLTDEGAPAPLPGPSASVPTQTIQVSPENVVELGVVFSAAADRLESEVQALRADLRLDAPWLGDPVSAWIWQMFNQFFVDGENSFASVVQRTYEQHQAHATALIEAAKEYGLVDELNAEIYRRLGPHR